MSLDVRDANKVEDIHTLSPDYHACRYNLNVLEEWLREHKLTCALDILQPIVQASKLLQMKKETEDDAKCISEFCANLNTQQV